MGSMPGPYELAKLAARRVADLTGVAGHDVLAVLGSGWGGAADALGTPSHECRMTDLPGFFLPIAEGHAGLVRSYDFEGLRALVMLGRTHLFEGHGTDPVVHAVRTAAAAGCRTAILTNANGSLRPDWRPGTGVLIADHLNLTGRSPLVGPRFVDLTAAWSPRLRVLAKQADPDLREGVYAMLPGPHYESYAEAHALRRLGADIIGMSTVLEAIAAREAGMELLGLSVVTAVEATGEQIDSAEVVRVAEAAATRLGGVIRAVVTGA